MRVGVSLRTSYAVDDPAAGVRMVRERAGAAGRARLDLLSVGDHHATGPVPYYQNTPLMGLLLAGWDGPRAGALFLLPLWHPLLVAEQVGTLAAMADGPFVLQCGLGDRRQCGAMGVDPSERASRLTAAVEVIRSLLAGEEVTTDGPWPMEGARVAPAPPQGIEIWIGAVARRAIDRAARLGDAWYAGPAAPLPEARDQLRHYLDRCAAHDRTPARTPIRRDVYVGSSRADVETRCRPVIERGHRGFSTDALVTGTVDEVVEQLAAFAAAGFTDVVVRQLVDDQAAAVESIERLGEVRRALAGV